MTPASYSLSSGACPEWDAFVGRNDDPHFEQMSAWGETQRLRGWTPLRLLQFRGQSLAGGAQILERPFGRFWRIAYLHRGPLWEEGGPHEGEGFAAELKRLCRSRNYLYFVAVLPYHSDGFARILARQDYPVLPEGLPPSSSMKATSVLDVTRPDAALLAGMHASTRRNVRKSMRSGVTIRSGTSLDVPIFADLLNTLCSRRGVRPNVPSGGEFLPRLWNAFGPPGQAAVFLAEVGDVPIAARFVLSIGRWVTDWRHGWSGEHRDLFPNEALDWHVIRWARARGAHFYDFCGVDTHMALKMSRGEPLLPGEVCGMSSYKLGFGGEILPLNPDYFWSASRLVRTGIRSVGNRPAASRVIRQLLGLRGRGRAWRERRI